MNELRRPPNAHYALVAAVLAAVVVTVVLLTSRGAGPAQARDLLRPVFVLAALTFVVLLLTASMRNLAVALGRVPIQYYRGYRVADGLPDERVERPARTYGNLLELPTLFYAACALMLATGKVDSTQVALAWTFVALRTLHALVYIAVNFVPLRFVLFIGGAIVLSVLWVRFGLQVL